MDVVSTVELAPGERFAFWREVSCKLWAPYEVRCDPQVESGFRAKVGISGFGPVQATLMTTMAHLVHRTPKLVRQADPEMFKLGCLLRGNGMITQGRQCTRFGVGDLILFDTSRSYQSEFAPDIPGSQQLMLLRFSRTLLPLPPHDLRRLSAVRIPGARGIGALSSQFLRHLAVHMDELTPSDTARLSTLTLDVLTTALADALDVQDTVPAHTRRRALMAQIHSFIRANLGDPGLTPEAHRRRLDPRAPPRAVPRRPRQPAASRPSDPCHRRPVGVF
jgi:hypothetical protein